MICRHALKPRLLIPIGLVLGFIAYNHLVDRSHRMGYVEIASLAAGFLASKVGALYEGLPLDNNLWVLRCPGVLPLLLQFPEVHYRPQRCLRLLCPTGGLDP